AQPSSRAEIARTAVELSTSGIKPRAVVINGVLPGSAAAADSLGLAVREREQAAIAGLPPSLASVGVDIIELKPENMVGLDALRSLLGDASAAPPAAAELPVDLPPSLDALIDELAADGHGLIMCMGKGGVGKTTIASAIATRL
ncbi:arsenical pump-driving ATPase, partial [Oceanobacillus luteolus]|nr:arsenical pump-driving ATPase [Oceanobacillus luteolus]